ncbi:hypothetical protein K431DRAFT_289169 [Polychaeton citri CBS 116435]|uniref:Dynamitin-domain-containing protein n=1 Tax=Polychaeton citri CBS 116435 TaxID=1314669 RepID=A0A9P4PXE6_9PEZI|nr:hypothetical protein K431DRAFT_289169 [Polychaeton citri CBS 116435]
MAPSSSPPPATTQASSKPTAAASTLIASGRTAYTSLASLPGYDTAPDIYESAPVPELTDDTATTRSSSYSGSSSGDDDNADEDCFSSHADGEDAEEGVEAVGGVSKRRIDAQRARTRFRGVGTGVGGRGRRREGAEVEESLEERIARLRREVEECSVLLQKGEEGGKKDGRLVGDERAELEKLVGGLEGLRTGMREKERDGTEDEDEDEEEEGEENQDVLAKVAAFDARLSSLERALGNTTMADALPSSSAAPPLLPTLTHLESQLSALASAPTSLSHLSSSLPPQPPPSSHLQDTPDPNLQSLYALLPTLTSLAPTIPALLARLKSLRTLHTGAATAATDLAEVERRQRELDAELKKWREGLEKVEGAVKEADAANGRNGRVVRGWVEGLESRAEKLGA